MSLHTWGVKLLWNVWSNSGKILIKNRIIMHNSFVYGRENLLFACANGCRSFLIITNFGIFELQALSYLSVFLAVGELEYKYFREILMSKQKCCLLLLNAKATTEKRLFIRFYARKKTVQVYKFLLSWWLHVQCAA